MIKAAMAPLSANRWTPFAFVVAFSGVDLTNVVLHAQVRLYADAPGAPLIDLPATADPTVTGVRFMSVDTSGAVPISYVRIQIAGAALGSAIPTPGEIGNDLALAWDLIVTMPGRTEAKWLYGPFTVSAGVTQLAAAVLANDPAPGSADALVTIDGEALSVSIGGLELITPLVAAANATLAAAKAVLAGTYITVADFDARGAIPPDELSYGRYVYVLSSDQLFQWTKNVPIDPDNPTGAVADNYVDVSLKYVINSLQSSVNSLNAAILSTANGILTAQSILQGQIDKLGAIEIEGFHAEAQTTSAKPPVLVKYYLRGSSTLLKVDLLWRGWRQRRDAKARPFRWRDWTKPVGILAVGNSFQDPIRGSGSYVEKYGAALNLPVTTAAVISADMRQVYRLGITPIEMTVAGNALPAGDGAASVAITAINGAAPSANNPASFMETFDGDTGTAGNTITGIYGGVHGTAKTVTNGTYNYTFIPDAGSPATAVPAGSLFVPDYALNMETDDLVIPGFQNSYFSPFTNQLGAPDYVNPTAIAQVDAIIRGSGGGRIQLLGLLPDANYPKGTIEYTGLLNYNAYMRSVYPDLYVVDANGNDFLATVLAYPGGNAADVAAGVTPRELRRDNGGGVIDSLHLSPTVGDVVAANLLLAHRAIQSIPPAMPDGTAISIIASGQDGIGQALSGADVAWVEYAGPPQLLPEAWVDGTIAQDLRSYTKFAVQVVGLAAGDFASFSISLDGVNYAPALNAEGDGVYNNLTAGGYLKWTHTGTGPAPTVTVRAE